MPPSRRAKQFQMFDALHGLREALAAAERSPVPRRWHSEESKEELGRTLAKLRPGERVTVVYYESGAGEYSQLTGEVTKVDGYWKCLQLGQVVIDFDEIWEVEPANGNGIS